MLFSDLLTSCRSSSSKNWKADKDFARKLNFEDLKFPVKIRDIHKVEKKNAIIISVFDFENKEKYPIYVLKKCCQEKRVDLLLKEQEGKRYHVLIKHFNTFMYDQIVTSWKKRFFVVIVYNLLAQQKY